MATTVTYTKSHTRTHRWRRVAVSPRRQPHRDDAVRSSAPRSSSLDRGLWNRMKLVLCKLLLMYSDELPMAASEQVWRPMVVV